MDTILQGLLDLPGVSASMVLDDGGRLVGHRGRAVYDRALCEQLGAGLTKAIDTVQLQQEDWESLTAQFADGALLVRRLSAPGGRVHVLAVVADATLNASFATVAIRVAVNKLRKALDGGAGAAPGATPHPATGATPHPAAGSSAIPVSVSDSRPALDSGLSWSRTSSVGLSRVAVADPASGAFLSRCAKELARHVGPIAKVYVEEAVRRVCPDAPFALPRARDLVEDLAGQIEDPDDRARFRKTFEKV